MNHDQIWGQLGSPLQILGTRPPVPPVIYAHALNGRRQRRYKGCGFSTLRPDQLALRWATVGLVYVTSHSGQLSLPPSEGPEMSTGQEWLALFAWEGNRRSGVAQHRPCVHHGLNGLLQGDQYLAYCGTTASLNKSSTEQLYSSRRNRTFCRLVVNLQLSQRFEARH